MLLITNDAWRKLLCQSINRAVGRWACRLVAFVLMPEHLHLLVLPTMKVEVDSFLSAVKRPHSVRIKRLLEQKHSPLLQRLTVQERPGKMSFRYWQEGPCYDRNLSTERAAMAAIDYIHENPVRRGLTRTSTDWRWSSARWYASDAALVDPDLPTIHGLPWDFLDLSKELGRIVPQSTSEFCRDRIRTGDQSLASGTRKDGLVTCRCA